MSDSNIVDQQYSIITSAQLPASSSSMGLGLTPSTPNSSVSWPFLAATQGYNDSQLPESNQAFNSAIPASFDLPVLAQTGSGSAAAALPASSVEAPGALASSLMEEIEQSSSPFNSSESSEVSELDALFHEEQSPVLQGTPTCIESGTFVGLNSIANSFLPLQQMAVPTLASMQAPISGGLGQLAGILPFGLLPSLSPEALILSGLNNIMSNIQQGSNGVAAVDAAASPAQARPSTRSGHSHSKKRAGRNLECANCHTIDTPMWRRGGENSEFVLCNRCGLYLQRRGVHRPPGKVKRSPVLNGTSSNGKPPKKSASKRRKDNQVDGGVKKQRKPKKNAQAAQATPQASAAAAPVSPSPASLLPAEEPSFTPQQQASGGENMIELVLSQPQAYVLLKTIQGLAAASSMYPFTALFPTDAQSSSNGSNANPMHSDPSSFNLNQSSFA